MHSTTLFTLDDHNLHTSSTPHSLFPPCPTPRTKKKSQASAHPLPASVFQTTPPVARGCHVARSGASEHSSRKTTRTRAWNEGSTSFCWRSCRPPKRRLRLFADPGSWVASGIAQFWNLMQEQSQGALTLTPRLVGRCAVAGGKKLLFLLFLLFLRGLCDAVMVGGR